MISEEYLIALNAEFSSVNMEHRKRPWEALRRYSADNNVEVKLSSEEADFIFEWFEGRSKPGSHEIGSLYESVYFYDGEFWLVSVPLSYGKVSLNALDCLTEMPSVIRAALKQDNQELWRYSIYWADCIDYGHGILDLAKSNKLNSFGKELLLAGNQEIKTAVSLLKDSKPDPRSILNSRMALEIFLKSFIALKTELTENEAQKIGHNLKKAFTRFIEVSGYEHLKDVEKRLKVYPQVNERYIEQKVTRSEMWEGLAIAQSIGTILVREFTDRNTLEQVFREL